MTSENETDVRPTLTPTLRTLANAGRIDRNAEGVLAWLTGGQQDRLAEWMREHPKRRIGVGVARRVVDARGRGESLDKRHLDRLLNSQARTPAITIPMSLLPAGLDRDGARAWVDTAIAQRLARERLQPRG